MKRILLADAINRKPSSSAFRYLISSSRIYGLTKGTEKTVNIELTPLGKSFVETRDPQDRIRILQEAAQKPNLFKKIYSYYKNYKLPSDEILRKTIETEFKVHSQWSKECTKILITDGHFTQIIQDVSGDPYVVFEVPELEEEEEEEVPLPTPILEEEVPPPTPILPKQIFVGHG